MNVPTISIIRTLNPWAPAGMSEGCSCLLWLCKVIMVDIVRICRVTGGKKTEVDVELRSCSQWLNATTRLTTSQHLSMRKANGAGGPAWNISDFLYNHIWVYLFEMLCEIFKATMIQNQHQTASFVFDLWYSYVFSRNLLALSISLILSWNYCHVMA